MKRLFALLFVLVLLAAVGIAWAVFAPYRGFSDPVYIDFQKGTSTEQIAGELAKNGVIRSPLQFVLVRALRRGALLQAGEYEFKTGASPWDVFGRIARGDVFYYEVTVPEGSNIFDIAAILERAGTTIGSAQFLPAARDTALIRDLAPGAATLEGYLFPSTYRITRHTTARQLCQRMTEQFRREWKQLGGDSSNVHRTVTLASLVEKETGVKSERPLVSSVFHNRLQRNMPLQCDPTAIYAALLEDRYRGAIFRSDLQSRNAYNTYQHAGLPPGPIANPGVASLKAALQPAQTEFLYFVAKGDGSGSHNFASDYEEHQRNVAAYRHSPAAQAR